MAGLFPFVSFKSLLSTQPVNSTTPLMPPKLQVPTPDETMMNGWTVPQVKQTVMHNGFWFVICASIESAWDLCNTKLLSGELTPDQEQAFIQEEAAIAFCRNDQLKYES
jgi:hypothetical protein